MDFLISHGNSIALALLILAAVIAIFFDDIAKCLPPGRDTLNDQDEEGSKQLVSGDYWDELPSKRKQ